MKGIILHLVRFLVLPHCCSVPLNNGIVVSSHVNGDDKACPKCLTELSEGLKEQNGHPKISKYSLENVIVNNLQP